MIAEFRTSLAVEMPPPASFMNRDMIEQLSEACTIAFEEPIPPESIEVVAHYCYHVGQRISGRCAGKLEDIVIRFLFRYYACKEVTIASPDACHLEIGVLFGAGVICTHKATSLAGRPVPIVAIDPFEGYYGASVDPVSKLEVTEERFLENLAAFDIPDKDIELVRGFSTDPAIFEPLRSLNALSVLIDGDHSYEGVLCDWRNFSPLVMPGGYVLVDDYRNPSWPEIARCADEQILPSLGSEWATRLIFGRTLLLQRGPVVH